MKKYKKIKMFLYLKKFKKNDLGYTKIKIIKNSTTTNLNEKNLEILF